MKWRGGKVNRGVMAVVLLALAGWIVPAGAAPVTARYVRVDNPTAPGMSLQEVEVYSGGENVALGKGDSVTGTWKVFPGRTPTEGRQLVDGNNDPNKRGPVFSNVDHDVLGAWIEIDLGESVPIDRAVVYGSSYNAYLDKGDRELTLLDDQRRVVWADKWNAFSASDGTFDMDVAGTEGTSPMNGQTVAANDRMNISMEWFLDDIESGRLPADSSTRMARFQERLSPQALSEVADELFSLLDPDVPELAKARELYAQKKPAEALDEYKRYWFAKMARENLKKGYHVLPPSYPGQADDLLNGVRVTIVSDAKQKVKAMRFTPGVFPWVVLPENERARDEVLKDGSFLAGVNNLQRPLLVRYDETGDSRYLQRWAELIDDWSMNYAKDAEAIPYKVQDNLGNCNAWNKTMEDLANIAEKHPEMIDLLPAATLARMQLRSLDEYGPAYWRLARETAFNHSVSNIQSWGFTVPYIREFLPGQRIDREWRQHMERWMTLFMEPDGSMVERLSQNSFLAKRLACKPA